MTPEDREQSPASRERMARWPRMDSQERERMHRAWNGMDRERASIKETRDALLKEARKGTTAMWRMRQRVEDIVSGLKETMCEACREDCGGNEKEMDDEQDMYDSAANEGGHTVVHACRERAPRGEKEKPRVMATCGGPAMATNPMVTALSYPREAPTPTAPVPGMSGCEKQRAPYTVPVSTVPGY